MSTFIVLPTQLCSYPNAFWKQWDRVVVIEDGYYINRKQHPLKLWMHRASMKEYFDKIPMRSIQKQYIEYDDSYKLPKEFTICHPTDKPMVKKYAAGRFIDPPNFILSVDELKDMDTPIQAVFYKRMRTKLDILMNNGKPQGGKWSFDSDNRSRYPIRYVDENILDKGYSNKYIIKAKSITDLSDMQLRVEHLPWPTNRSMALRRLNRFVKAKLDKFGPYQDAIRSDVLVGYHSCISASLNIGLLTPYDIIKVVDKSKAPIQSREGLIRQVIGWREFIRLRYILYGLQPWTYLKKMNTKLDKSWYVGNTGIETLDWSINRVLKYAYAPHIERLMLLLNYAILLRLRYEDVRKWFISCFIDAIGEWQMLNIEMGVSSFSKHKFMTKVYLTSGSYLLKQGLVISKTDQEQLKRLYRSFIIDNKSLASKDYRLAAQVKKLSVK
jgi:deoxyribodipyrimidine photolyase-related protein